MKNDKYAIFDALNPFFEIVQEGLTGLVDGKHFFDTIAEDAFFDFRYNFPGWPLTIRGRADLMDQFSGYGDTIRLHSADGLVVHRSQDRRVVILEYDVDGVERKLSSSHSLRSHKSDTRSAARYTYLASNPDRALRGAGARRHDERAHRS